MTSEQMLAVGGFAITAGGVLVNALWLMRRVTQSESEIKSSIQSLGASTATEIKTLGDSAKSTIEHMHQINGMRFDELSRRVGGVEGTLSKITRITVFPEGRES